MLISLIVILQAICCICALVYWTRNDDFYSIAKVIQNSRDPSLLNGFSDNSPESRKSRRIKAKEWIKLDEHHALFWGLRSVLTALYISIFILLISTVSLLVINLREAEDVGIYRASQIIQELSISLVDGATFDLFYLVGAEAEYPAETFSERISVFIFLISELLIISALIAYLFQSLISKIFISILPVNVYRAATDSRDYRGRTRVEKIIRFAMDFEKHS